MMKRRLIVFGLLFFMSLVGIVSAIPNPAWIYCEQTMGYTANLTHCIFPDGESCELWSFFSGECGEEYVLDLECVGLGGVLLPGKECCEGLVFGLTKDDFDENCEGIVGDWPACFACGDGFCDEQYEDICSCEEDCSGFSNNSVGGLDCTAICGDGFCDLELPCEENSENCPGDCTATGGPVCGNGACEGEGEEQNCPEDCSTQQICESLCGDGECQEVVCQGEGCPCPETFENCPEDCAVDIVVDDVDGGSLDDESRQDGWLKGFSSWWIIVFIIAAVVFVIIGLKLLKWVFWSLAVIAVILAVLFFVF
ncbi:MAG: hypothetical protein ABIH92_00105 [Nanoarchaeota archaeon]